MTITAPRLYHSSPTEPCRVPLSPDPEIPSSALAATTMDQPTRPPSQPGIDLAPNDPPDPRSGPSSSPSVPARSQSASWSSVHFADPLRPHRSSIASLRESARQDQTLTPPRSVTRARSTSPLGSLPVSSSHDPNDSPHPLHYQSFGDNSQGGDAGPVSERRPSLAHMSSSQDRRIRSDSGMPPRSDLPLITHGKRASVVTGGYESTDSDTSSGKPSAPRFRNTRPASASLSATGPLAATGTSHDMLSDHTRQLKGAAAAPLESGFHGTGMTTPPITQRTANARSSIGHGRPSSTDRNRKGSREHMRVSSKRRPSPSANTPSRATSQKSSHRQSFPTPRQDSLLASVPPSRTPSTRFAPDQPQAGPSRSVSTRIRELDAQREQGLSGSESRKRLKDKDRRADALAASLGLDSSGKDVALSPDQINNLLNESDVGSALRLMHSSHLNPRMPNLRHDPSTSSFSPGSSRPTSPGLHQNAFQEPFIVHAPPALTQPGDSPPGRLRNISISGHITSAPRSPWKSRTRQSPEMGASDEATFGERRRRASSQAKPLPGHVPFTHHVPVVTVDDYEASDHDEPRSANTADTPPPLSDRTVSDDTPRSVVKTEAPSKNGGLAGRGRLSQLFHIKRKKSSESIHPSDMTRKSSVKDHQEDKEKEREKERERERVKEREKERSERDLERRRLEQERRDAELAQERRFRALTQVAAHPDAERLAYRASSHLRAYYNHVYEDIDNPPKLNALAILRWKHKSEEQVDAKCRWERRSKLSHGRPISPHSVAHLGCALNSSPGSLSSSRRPRESDETGRPKSKNSGNDVDQSSSKSRRDGPGSVLQNWQYTVEDIANYKAADGVVNYFIPPRQPVDFADNSKTSLNSVAPDDKSDNRSKSSKTRGDSSSPAGSLVKRKRRTNVRVTSASAISLSNGTMDGEGDIAVRSSPAARTEALSRVASNDTGSRHSGHKEPRITHRAHQSLSAMGPTSLSHVLKAPFEKFGSVGKRQRSGLPLLPIAPDESYDSPIEGNSSRQDSSLHPSLDSKHTHHSILHAPHHAAQFANRVTSSVTGHKDGIDHGDHHKTNGGSHTDEDRRDRESRLRKPFLKGQRAFPLHPRRTEIERMSSGGGLNRPNNRQAELKALQTALTKESAFRERQVEADRKTKLEVETRQRMEQLEEEIYVERSQQVAAARKRVATINAGIENTDVTMRHYLAQVDQLAMVAKHTAEVDVNFPNLDILRKSYDRKSGANLASSSQRFGGEAADIVGPLRHALAYESPSDANSRRSNSRSNSMNRRRSSVGPLPALLSFGVKPWPRRTSLDPKGTTRVDPIRRVELSIAHLRDEHQSLLTRRDDTLLELQSMLGRIDACIKQKDAVRSWTKTALESNRTLRVTVDMLHAQIRGNWGAKMRRYKDKLYDATARQIISPVIKVSFQVYSTVRWTWSRRSVEARTQFRSSRRDGSERVPWLCYLLFVSIFVFALLWYLGGSGDVGEL